MIPAKDFIVVEVDIDARFFKTITLKEFNDRRTEEFKSAFLNTRLVIVGVYETKEEADLVIANNEVDVDKCIEAIVNGLGELPY